MANQALSPDAPRHRWYGMAAAGVAALAVPDARAQVVSVEFDPNVVVRDRDFTFDLDGDDDPELTFRELPGRNHGDTLTYLVSGGDQLSGLIGVARTSSCTVGHSWFYALGPGVTVSSQSPDLDHLPEGCGNGQDIFQETSTFGGWADFPEPPAFIGLEFSLNGVLHYGWIGLWIPIHGLIAEEIRIGGYAYNATPGAPVTTGDMGTAAPAYPLDAALSQTDFPPEGGPVALSAAVTNTTGDEATLDLWAVMGREGGAGQDRVLRLRTSSVAAGATVTESFALEVPAWAPAGRYEVRVHVGHYPGARDTEVFTVTKAGAAGIGDEGDAAALLVREPAEGARFGGSATDGAAAASSMSAASDTYVLSAASPNPSGGRVWLTLGVAEAQHVTVSVHDALGRRVATLHEGVLASGPPHRLTLDGSGLPSGVYAVRAVGETFSTVRILTLAH